MQSAIHRVARAALSALIRLAKWALVLIVLLIVATTVAIQLSGDPDFTYIPPETLVNDITTLNPTHVARTVRPQSIEQVAAIVAESAGPISIGGGRFSQGGQIAQANSLHIDTRDLDDVLELDVDSRRIRVEAGITWREIQDRIDAEDLAVKIMQSYANFTVGGSLSVNGHGRYIGEGPLVRSVESITIVLADGSVVQASPEQNAEIFYGAIGGYGGLGVIVAATLELVQNDRVERRVAKMPVDEYAEYFRAAIRDDANVVFHNADLYPPDYRVANAVSFFRTDKPVTVSERLIPTDVVYRWRPRIAGWVAGSGLGGWTRQHVIDPMLFRSDAVVYRNYEASYDVAELEPRDRLETTYALREYFVPVARFDSFVERMREIFTEHEAEIINVSVRHALPDPGTLLAWADEEVYAFVVYYRQGKSREAQEAVRAWSLDMIDAVLEHGGTYYLPYQVFASPKQFHAAYPRAGEFFELKARLDPDNRFRNRLWQQHYPANWDGLESVRTENEYYFRGVEQTLLTIPEWYLVFNPVEYAAHLQSDASPSDFAYFASIDEFWSLYDRVRTIAEARGYPENAEYLTMLRVIGISTTAELVVKGTYENTIGRLTRWTAGDESTPEDRLIADAHRAYGETIFDVAWYEFDFPMWMGRIWTDVPFFGPNMIRKLERKFSFTLEFAFKSVYAKLIGFASRTAYGERDDRIYMTVGATPVSALRAAGAELVASSGRRQIISIQRWGPFSEAMPKLTEAGVNLVEIAGNDEIAVTIVGPVAESLDFAGNEPLFDSRVLSDDTLVRHAILVPVSSLSQFIAALKQTPFRLEHIYDY